MSLPRYERYEHSGIDWLGEVQAHWKSMSLGKVTESKCDGPFGSCIKSEHYPDYGALVIRLQNIRTEGFAVGERAFIDADYFDRELRGHEVDSRAIQSRGQSADAREGVSSFLEKRPAVYANKVSTDMPDFFPW